MPFPKTHLGLCAVMCLAASPAVSQEWTGPYLGFHIGGAYGDFTNAAPGLPGPDGDSFGALGGVQLGFNWQTGQMVVGAEADFSATDLSDGFATGSFEEDAMTSLRLRAGRVKGDTLLFGSLGVAWTEKETTLNGVGTDSRFEPGLMLGGGAERFLSDRVSGRVEAYVVDVPRDSQNVSGTPASGGSQNVIFRAGLNLHF